MSKEERIHIALSPWDLSDDYNRHAGVTVLSILDHTEKPVTLHLLYDEKLCEGKEENTAYNKSCYQEIADKYGCILEYHHVSLPDWMNEIQGVKSFTPGSMMRLSLPEILPDLEKIIYFDCDLVVNTNVDALWALSLGDVLLAACLENKNFKISHNIRIKEYCNAGVMVLNLKRFRQDPSFIKTVYQFLFNNRRLSYPDQDVLNWYCDGNHILLDEKYNINSQKVDAIKYVNDGIIHYKSSGGKPWKLNHGEIDNIYWEYLQETPWCQDSMVYTSYVRQATNMLKAMSLLEDDFFMYLPGSWADKLKFILKLFCSVIKSSINGIIRKF